MDNDRQQAIAAVDFTGRWAVRGYEKGKNQEFWLELLVDVLRVTIEQKSLGKDLRKPLLQCDGAMMGLLSVGSGEGLMAWGGSLKTGAKIAVQSVIGGTLSELGGGNFANGAITAAFSFLFNHLKHFQNSFLNIKSGQIPNDLKASQTGLYGSKITVMGTLEENGNLLISIFTAGGSKAALVDGTIVRVKASLVLDGHVSQILYCKPVNNDGNYYFAETGFEQLAKGSFESFNVNSYNSVKVIVETRWSAVMSGNHQYTPTAPGTIGFYPISARNVVVYK